MKFWYMSNYKDIASVLEDLRIEHHKAGDAYHITLAQSAWADFFPAVYERETVEFKVLSGVNQYITDDELEDIANRAYIGEFQIRGVSSAMYKDRLIMLIVTYRNPDDAMLFRLAIGDNYKVTQQ